jgi:hypothetical protein
MAKRTKRTKEKRPLELTDDEAMEHLFSKEVRDEAKRVAQNARKADRNGKSSPHKWSIQGTLPCVKYIIPNPWKATLCSKH